MSPILLKSLAVFLTTCSLATAASVTGPLQPRQSNPSTGGPYVPFYSSWWTDGTAPVVYTNGAGGQTTIQWSMNGVQGRFIGGKGYNPGSNSRTIRYSGQFKATPDSTTSSFASLSIYGWTRNPLVEYHIVESYTPNIYPLLSSSNATLIGTTTCDSSTYSLYQTAQTGKPSIDGDSTNFRQYWSVRTSGAGSGTGALSGAVTVNCHASAWGRAGMILGSSHSYQILATEAVGGSGTSFMTISE